MSKEINLNLLTGFKNSPKFTIASRIPPREHQKGMPGPGNYINTNTEKDKFSTTPKWSIASGQRDAKEWGVFPGPGQYAPSPAGKTLPKWGFGSEPRLHEVKRDRGPGPGQYETRGKLDSLAFSVCSRPEGGSKRSSSTPGPGEYKPKWDQMFDAPPKASFGASSRSELAMSKTPGPGQYDSDYRIRPSHAFTIQGKKNQPATDQTPGPELVIHSR